MNANSPRCTRIIGSGRRCKNPALVGYDFCRMHGGSLPRVKQKNEILKAARDSAIRPIDANDPESRGDFALANELRRTIAWIRFCEANLAALGASPEPDADTDDALADVLGGLGIVSRRAVSGMERGEETDLVETNYAAGVSVWEEKLRWNRAHLATLTKQWIAAGFEARRLELAERTVNAFEKAQEGILRDLGIDTRNADVRAVIQRRLSEVAGSSEIVDSA